MPLSALLRPVFVMEDGQLRAGRAQGFELDGAQLILTIIPHLY